jgi:hypothetical protein
MFEQDTIVMFQEMYFLLDVYLSMIEDIQWVDTFDVDLHLPIKRRKKNQSFISKKELFLLTNPNLKHEPQCVNVSGLKFKHTSSRNGVNFFQSSSS